MEQARNIKIKFHDSLIPFTRTKEHVLNIKDYYALFSAINSLFPKLDHHMRNIVSNKTNTTLFFITQDKKIVNEHDFIKNEIPDNIIELYIVPTLYGSGGRAGKFLLGAAIAAFALFALPVLLPGVGGFSGLTGFGALLGKTLLGVGINIALGALLEQDLALNDTLPGPTDSSQRKNNDIFSGFANTVDSRQPVPMIYGLTRQGGHLLSGYTKTIKHSRNENVKLSDHI